MFSVAYININIHIETYMSDMAYMSSSIVSLLALLFGSQAFMITGLP